MENKPARGVVEVARAKPLTKNERLDDRLRRNYELGLNSLENVYKKKKERVRYNPYAQ